MSAATSAAAGSSSSRDTSTGGGGLSALIPPNLVGAGEKTTFIAAQRERLNVVLGALDREAQVLEREESLRGQNAETYPRAGSWTLDGSGQHGDDEEPTQRPSSSGYGFGDWNRNRSESDFEKVDAESGAEDERGVRRRTAAPAGGSWMPWGWGGATPTEHDRDRDHRDRDRDQRDSGASSGRDYDR